MIMSVQFKNFRILRDCTLPLGRFNLLIGPNGSGKTTVFNAMRWLGGAGVPRPLSVELNKAGNAPEVAASVETKDCTGTVRRVGASRKLKDEHGDEGDRPVLAWTGEALKGMRVYDLSAGAIAAPVKLKPQLVLGEDGGGLAGVLDRLRDQHPERFEELNAQLGRWLPEFDRVLFDTPSEGQRSLSLRVRAGGHRIEAADLSQGTLLALAMLTLAYLPDPPAIVGFEEPGRGIHPRLLREVRDALYRLAYPDGAGESRSPVQVIATTHSPHLLDLFRDHPEEVVLCEKLPDAANVRFHRLSDLPHVEEILADTQLGDAWYSGILGGVPLQS